MTPPPDRHAIGPREITVQASEVQAFFGQTLKIGLRKLLHEETMALHALAESSFERRAKIETPIGLSHFLNCMFQTHLRFRSELDSASRQAGIVPRSEALIGALAADLKRPPDELLSADPVSEAYCLGVGYVLEGSSLGAGILRKRLAKAKVPPTAYLSRLTSDAKTRWPRFVEMLDTQEGQHTETLRGATTTFDFIISQSEQAS